MASRGRDAKPRSVVTHSAEAQLPGKLGVDEQTLREGPKRTLGALLRSVAVDQTVAWCRRNGIFFAFLLLILVFSLINTRFATASNLKVILLQASVVGLIAVPGAMLILSGYVDLSVGSVAVLSSVMFGHLADNGMSVGLSVAVAVIAALAWGIGNGVLIAYLGFSAIIVTLGGLAAARGVAEFLSEGTTTFSFGATFGQLGNGEFIGISVPVWILVCAFLIGAYFWYQAPYGRHMTAIGADKTAAHSLGLAVRGIPFALYAASGVAAALGGLILTSQLDAASLSIGNGLELQVLTAILLGGVSFVGGRGSLFGVLIGVLFIAVLQNGLIVVNVGLFVVGIALGGALVFAAGLDVLYQRLDRRPVRESDDEKRASQASQALRPHDKDAL